MAADAPASAGPGLPPHKERGPRRRLGGPAAPGDGAAPAAGSLRAVCGERVLSTASPAPSTVPAAAWPGRVRGACAPVGPGPAPETPRGACAHAPPARRAEQSPGPARPGCLSPHCACPARCRPRPGPARPPRGADSGALWLHTPCVETSTYQFQRLTLPHVKQSARFGH